MGKYWFVLVFVYVCLICETQAQFVDNSSEFAGKKADSYSNFKNEDGTPGVLRWGNAPVKDFGIREVKIDVTGVRKLVQAPPPGVHPRIFFGPDELPDLRRRTKETKCGQAAWKNILSWTEMMKGNYDDKADYAQPDVWKGTFGGLHGRVPLFRLGIPRQQGAAYNHHPQAAKYYNELANGTATNFPEYYWNVFSLEAFRCLIEADASGAKKLAAAAHTALKLDQAKRDSIRQAKKAVNPIEQPIGAVQMAFTYDFIFDWLTPEQKKAFHDELALCTWSHDNYGTFNSAEGSRGNWATFSYWLLEVLGIEGEPGFNDLKVKGMYRGWRNLMTYGWFPSGATYEGEAKNQLGMDGVIPFAKRQKMYGFEDLSGHPHLQAYAKQFLPLSVVPSLDGFVRYDLLGGSRSKVGGPNTCDMLGLKYMFPDDAKIDWLYRTFIKDDYSNVPDRPDGYFNGILFYAVFATDYTDPNGTAEKAGLPNTFFCGERALMMTRSGWKDKDELMLNMHTRQANGGHPFSDRNAIMLAGAGRVWSPVQFSAFENDRHSLLTIDKMKQDEHTPGTMVAFKDATIATFCAGDAKYCWDWNNKEQDKPGGKGYYTVADVRAGKTEMPKKGVWELEPNSVNHFSYTKHPFAYLDAPRSETQHWLLPKRAVRPFLRQINYPVKHAFRTAGIVRADRPYAIVVDDMEKDDKPHLYDWTLTLEHDVQMVRTTKINDRETEILLTGNDPDQNNGWGNDSLKARYEGTPKTGQPMLLVKVLNMENAAEPYIVEDRGRDPKSKQTPVRKLVVPSTSVSAKLKVLLYPYREGAAGPNTSWNKKHDKLSVKWPDGKKQEIGFIENPDGRTRIRLEAGKEQFEL